MSSIILLWVAQKTTLVYLYALLNLDSFILTFGPTMKVYIATYIFVCRIVDKLGVDWGKTSVVLF